MVLDLYTQRVPEAIITGRNVTLGLQTWSGDFMEKRFPPRFCVLVWLNQKDCD